MHPRITTKSRGTLEGRVTGLVERGGGPQSPGYPATYGAEIYQDLQGSHLYPLPRACIQKVLNGGREPCCALQGALHPALSSGSLWPCRLCGLELCPPLSPHLPGAVFMRLVVTFVVQRLLGTVSASHFTATWMEPPGENVFQC